MLIDDGDAPPSINFRMQPSTLKSFTSPLCEVLNQVTTLISELARKDDISALFEQDEIIEHLEYSRRGLVNCRNYSLTREKKSEKFNIFERTI